MIIKLIDFQNGVVVPSEHCYILKDLKAIIDSYPDKEEQTKIFAYLFYMTCPTPDNPYFNFNEDLKEESILDALQAEFSTEDDLILNALNYCKKLYSTPTSRAYEGIKKMLDRLADYMGSTQITSGRDGNISALVMAASKFEAIRTSFKGAYKDLQEEQKATVRGGANLSYDQN